MFSSSNRRGSGYRSARSVKRPNHRDINYGNTTNTKWTRMKIALVSIGTAVMAMTTILPMMLLEQATITGVGDSGSGDGTDANHHSLHSVIAYSKQIKEGLAKAAGRASDTLSKYSDGHGDIVGNDPSDDRLENSAARPAGNEQKGQQQQQQQEEDLARGVAGLPMSQTPALIGARRGHIECDVDVDDMAYWNDPQGKRDQEFESPFAKPPPSADPTKKRYLTFEPDPGGWNNIRMSMEIIFVMAAVTGRTLVLPPKAPFYLLGMGKENARSFGSFYNVEHPAFQNEVEVISMSEFLEAEKDGILQVDDDPRKLKQLRTVADTCVYKKDSPIHCKLLFEHLRPLGYQPEINANHYCYIFDKDVFEGKEPSDETQKKVDRFCGQAGKGDGKRKVAYYDKTTHEPQLIHWDASGQDRTSFRLLNHFYSFLLFTDQVVDNHYKRFVRDFLHYKDSLYCSAGKVVHALNDEGKEWSTLHVRRGDLQYKQVKIPAEEWYENLKEIWNPGEILFIATDERNKTFFDPLKEHHEIRFLDDYWDAAQLGELDPYFLSMVDTIVASHGRTFSGTWFSTFSGYINRMRGYLGYSMKDSWYGWKDRKDAVQEYQYPVGNYGAREWPIGWIGIDGDTLIEHELSPPTAVKRMSSTAHDQSKEHKPISVTIDDLETDEAFRTKPLARGLAGRDPAETPALDNASRGTIECDVNVDSLAYWNDPQGTKDENFQSPFLNTGEERYISFGVDRGGWNNVRMSMEIIFVIAAATGRTLVIPPKEPLYRLAADTANKFRGFADFFPLDTPEFLKRVKTITFAEFVRREGGPNGRFPVPEEMRQNVTNVREVCEQRQKSPQFCGHVADYLNTAFAPDARTQDYCLVFDKDLYAGRPSTDATEKSMANFCGDRKRYIWTSEINDDNVLINFRAAETPWRLLGHFYNFILFTDPAISNHFKRFVRDFLHYNNEIFCAAGKIVKALQAEGKQRGFEIDEEGGGGFSAMHIRRGDFQYKKVKISAREWLENTKEVWMPNEILYIATDERNKTFFDDIAAEYTVRYLDDYWDIAGLGDIDPNYFGMIDTIISSRARAFAGTWFSTFTGYINRMRGYHGMTMKDSWYSFLQRKTKLHTWEDINGFAYAYEWPDGWIGIDADVLPDHEHF